ncbi:ribosomal protection-like ABC-F family protein [Rummeliibacillus sp. NPDC094406]|uniref:ribosomal protection-like ABC-F family protein n=1 Tax=Rummeliibacillus sp. NPDC094406 TaxID=3364511 RepID=UPI0037F21E16
MSIKAENITKSFGGHIIFENLTVEVQTAEHVAIVGNNGCGKTTLLQLLAGVETPDAGRIIKKKDSSIGYLHQIPFYPNHTVKDVLMEAFTTLLNIQRKMSELEQQMATTDQLEKILKEYGHLQEQFIQLEGYEMDSKMASVANGLGINHLLNQSFSDLSGGEKTKVMLGQILLQNSSVLLLDEPTNHLDLQAIEWLEEYVKDFAGTVIVVSHDRQFMNNVVQKVIELEDGEASTFHGNYDAYVKGKEEKVEQEFAQYEEQQKKIKKMKEAIKRLRQWANEASPPNPDLYRKAKSMEKALQRIELVKKPKTEKKMNLQLEASDRSGKEVISIENVTKTYKSSLFDDVNFSVYWQDRLAIVGENGTGKSTLLKMMLGEVKPDIGRCIIGSNVKIGYLAQQFETLDDQIRLIDAFRENISMTEEEARHVLAQFLFYGYDVYKKVRDLSGGEKMRLRLAQLMQQDINLLILDEPTNHLDIESREVLEDNLQNFAGTIIAVSHDRYFLQKIFTKIAWIEQQTVMIHHGDYQWAKEKQQANIIHIHRKAKDTKTTKQAKQLTTEQQIEKIEKRMQQPHLSEQEYGKLRKQLDRLYEDWLAES